MNAAQAKELIGKYGIFQIGDNMSDNLVEAVSPSGKFVQLRHQGWQSLAKVSFIEELPNDPYAVQPLATASTVAEVRDQQAQLQAALEARDTAVDAARQSQDQLRSLSEQLGQAKREIILLKQALTEDKPILASAAVNALTFPTPPTAPAA